MRNVDSYDRVRLFLALSLAIAACRPSVDDNEPVALASNGVVADGSITTVKLADGAVTAAKVADAAITPEKLSKAYLPLAGGTMTGALNMGGQSLTNLATPTSSTDAVTKNYADTKVAGYSLDTSGVASITNGQALTWDAANARWTPTTVVGGANATQIQGVNVAGTAPTANQAFYYNNGLSRWEPGTLPVAGGGTGAVTLTSNGILLGNSAAAVTATAAMTNGQLLIGSTGVAPVPAALTGTANQVTITNGAGTITLAGPQNLHTGATPTFAGMTLTGALNVSAVPGKLARGYLSGYTLTNNGGNPNTRIDIAAGDARAIGNDADLLLSASITKRLDAVWAVGTNNGGLDTGASANSTFYHVYVISDGTTVDVLFSTSFSAPTMPGVYTYKRRIGSIMTNSSGNIRAFIQRGDYFEYVSISADCDLPSSAGTCGVGAVTANVARDITVSAPPNSVGRFLVYADDSSVVPCMALYPVGHSMGQYTFCSNATGRIHSAWSVPVNSS